MTWLLQWYIFRELGKSFILWAIGLTMVFSLCGGVLNMIQVEGASAIQMAQVLGFVLPVALTLTLPVSALVSTALTYGRLSADNEFNACRSSGINIHMLLLPTLVVSLAVAVFTFSFSNFVIPEFIRNLDQMLRKDLHKIVMSQLRTKGFLSYGGKYVMYADRIIEDPQHEANAVHPLRKDIFILGGAFIELAGEEWLRFGTAKSAVIRFDNSGVYPTVMADLRDVRGYDRSREQYVEEAHQPLGPFSVPQTFEIKAKWLDLPALLYYRKHPQESPEILRYAGNLRLKAGEALFYRYLQNTLVETGVFTFSSDRMRGELRTPKIFPDAKTNRPTLENPTVVLRWPDRTQRYKADRGVVRVRRAASFETELPQVLIALYDNVELYDSEALNPKEPIKKPKESLDPFPVPAGVRKQAEGYSDRDLLVNDLTHLSKETEMIRQGLAKEIQKMVLEMTGIVHARSAFSASVFVLVILGAALGIILRGSDYLTAFFISFLPGLFIVVSIVMGRQLTENSNTSNVGIAIIWGVIVLVAAADVVVLTKFLRR